MVEAYTNKNKLKYNVIYDQFNSIYHKNKNSLVSLVQEIINFSNAKCGCKVGLELGQAMRAGPHLPPFQRCR